MADLQLAEIMAALSQVTDLGLGAPSETAIRSCLVSVNLARHMGIDEQEVSAIYYTTLLQHLGCTAYAHETAALAGGDDITLIAEGGKADDTSLRDTLVFMLSGVARHQPLPARARAIFNVMRAGPSFPQALKRATCEVAVRTADRLGLPPDVQRGLDTVHARWDGKGVPGIVAEEIAPTARFAQVAGQAILFHDLGGPDLAIETIRRRAGAALDPAIADAFTVHGRELLAEVDASDPMVSVVDAEPEPRRRIPDTKVDEIARAFADLVDVKAPFMHGHSTAVSRLAETAATDLQLSRDDVTTIRRAGLLHELGRVGIPNGIWEKPGPLTTTEWDQVRLHPYHGERVLSRSPVLAPLAPLAGMHHERMDGSGYYRQLAGSAIPVSARVLATANAYHAMTEDRPYRPGQPPGTVADRLVAEADAGRFDPQVVDAVLNAAGQPRPPRHHQWPAGLTDREIEVLRLAARGLSNKEIGDTLFISPKTAGHHIQHIYDKIGVSTRAGAAIFTMEHDLIHEPISDK